MEECEHGSPYGACVIKTCSHSLNQAAADTIRANVDFKLIEANYPGRCFCGCDENIEEGDSVMWHTSEGMTILESHFKEYIRNG